MQKYTILFIFQVIALNCLSNAGSYGPVGVGGNPVRQKLIIAQIQLKSCARLSNMTIQANMKTVQLKIDEQVRASQNKTEHGEEQCVSAHTNLLAQLDSNYLKSCDQSVELGAITWKLSLIHAQIWMCKFATDPSLCYDDFEKQIDWEIDNGDEVCHAAPIAASECFDTKYDEALEIISKADREFAQCNV